LLVLVAGDTAHADAARQIKRAPADRMMTALRT
jgi:hypothetical protein